MRTKLVGDCSVCKKQVGVKNCGHGTFFTAHKHNINGKECAGSYEEVGNLRTAAMRPYKRRDGLALNNPERTRK